MKTIVDHEKTAFDMSAQQLDDLADLTCEAWLAATEMRKEHEDRATDNWALYRKSVDAVAQSRQDRKGWSKIEVPLIFWLVETMLPRLGVSPPQLVVTPRNADAAPYAYAKQLRMNHYISESDWESVLVYIAKSQLVLGDGFGKVVWNKSSKMPHLIWVNWHNFFPSADAIELTTGEWIFHRTYWTKNQLEHMADPDGADSVYRDLGEVIDAGPYGPDQDDPTYDERREKSGYLSGMPNPNLYTLVEAWHEDGSYVAFAPSLRKVVRAQKSPFHDHKGRLLRPFVSFSSTPDLNGPYSVSLPEILEDHQIELSTVRNQFIDQITGNINAGVVHDASIPDELVEDFLSAPNGRLPVEGLPDVRAAVMRLPPGQVSSDFPLIYDQLRSEAQMASGVSDISAGQSSISGVENQTATGMQIISAEANKRMQMLIKFAEIGIGNVAKLFDAMDRQFGGALFVPTEADFVPKEDMGGFGESSPGFASILALVNRKENEWQITVDSGSSQRPDQYEETQRWMQFIGAMTAEPIAPLVDWSKIAQKMVSTFGMNPEEVLLTPEQLQQREQQAQQQQAQAQQADNEAAVAAELAGAQNGASA